jgi:hypothetical protein
MGGEGMNISKEERDMSEEMERAWTIQSLICLAKIL